MSTRSNILIILLSASLFWTAPAIGQVVVNHVVSGQTPPTGSGFYYSLPQTVLRVQMTLREIHQVPGPLAGYAEEVLGVTDFIRTEKRFQTLENVLVTDVSVPDPGQMYYVQLPAERGKDEKAIRFQLSELGVLAGVNTEGTHPVAPAVQEYNQTLVMDAGGNGTDYSAAYNKRKQIDTVVRRISIDTVTIDRFLFRTSWVEKSDRERAEEAARQIEKIREARFNLLTGYHEVNFGESLPYMDAQLRAMEAAYLALFIGKETVSTEQQVVWVVPQPEVQKSLVYKNSYGDSMYLEAVTDDLPSGISAPGSEINKVFYRLPAQALLKLKWNDDLRWSERLTVDQLGVVSSVSLHHNALDFNPETGNLTGVRQE